MKSFIHMTSSRSHLTVFFLRMCRAPLGARIRLMMGTRQKIRPKMRCAMRMMKTTSGPAALVSGGTKTNRPVMASRMQEMATVP